MDNPRKTNRTMHCVVVSVVIFCLMMMVQGQNVPMVRPISFSLPRPPRLIGPLSANSILTNAEIVHKNLVGGPVSFVNVNGSLYAGTYDNKIYDLSSCPPRLIANLSTPGCTSRRTCGIVMSLRLDPTTGYLLSLDPYRGIFATNLENGQAQQIYSVMTPIKGRRPVHLNDMVVSPGGIILMTDSSDAYDFYNSAYICVDGRPTGRIVGLIPKTGELVEVLAGKINFPNGIEFTPDGDLLVAELCRARVLKVSLHSATWLQVTPFSSNLPGLPDNIRSSGRGTYWVAMSYPRHESVRNPVDETSRNPQRRRLGFRWVSIQRMLSMFGRWAMAVEIDANGKIIRSLQDPTGSTLNMISEINEFDGVLNIGSHLTPYMVRVLLPELSGNLSVESYIQVQRSRCKLADSQVPAERERLTQQMNRASGTQG